MKKSRLLILLAVLAVAASGCGYSTGGEDSTVTVIEATPTPTATYYAIEGVNVRSDCSTDAQIITGTTVGQALTSTGVSEDGQWVEVTVNNQTGYVSSQYVSTEAPAGTATTGTTAQAAQ